MEAALLRGVLLDAHPNQYRPQALRELADDCKRGARLFLRQERPEAAQELLNLAFSLRLQATVEERRWTQLQHSASLTAGPVTTGLPAGR